MEQKGSYFSVIVLPWSSCYSTLPTCPSFSTSMMSCAHGDLGMDVIPSSGVMHKESSCVHLCRWVQKSVLQPQPSTCYSSPDRQGPKGPLPERRLSGAMLLMVMFSQLQTAWWLTAVLSQDHAVNRQCSGLVTVVGRLLLYGVCFFHWIFWCTGVVKLCFLSSLWLLWQEVLCACKI